VIIIILIFFFNYTIIELGPLISRSYEQRFRGFPRPIDPPCDQFELGAKVPLCKGLRA